MFREMIAIIMTIAIVANALNMFEGKGLQNTLHRSPFLHVSSSVVPSHGN